MRDIQTSLALRSELGKAKKKKAKKKKSTQTSTLLVGWDRIAVGAS